MSGALLSFIGMAIAARELSAAVGTFEILFFRSLIGLAVIAALLHRYGWRHARSARPGIHLLRNTAHFAGQFGWFYAISLIPLAEVFAIEFTVPIWTALLAAFLLGERITATRLAAIAIGIAGIALILRPGAAVVQPAAIAALLSALAYGLSHTLTKKLVGTDRPLTILFYMTVIQLPFGLIGAVPHWVWPAPAAWPWLAVVGLTALSAHYCMTRALALADATVVVPMDFLRLPLIALLGFMLYGERIEWYLFAGAALIVGANLLNIRAEQRRARQAGAPAAR
jgi:drug/metabolite transporter (DMT)-like permease